MQTTRQRFAGRSARGATAVEYALLVSLIAAVMVAGVMVLGPTVLDFFTDASENW